jgi:uncharacterized protein involved in outer membrane biogenesis
MLLFSYGFFCLLRAVTALHLLHRMSIVLGDRILKEVGEKFPRACSISKIRFATRLFPLFAKEHEFAMRI